MLVLGLVLATTTSIFLIENRPALVQNAPTATTPIANYFTGSLLNVPTYITQPYFEAARDGCPIVDRPVCGVDGKTYQNECFQKVAGVVKAYEGWCIGSNEKKPDAPTLAANPFAEVEETGFLRFGTPTTGSCPCNDTYYPVCSNRGITYANLCRAKCFGEYAVQVGACNNFYYKPVPNLTCKCTYSQERVCATDGATYENSCVMLCAGAIFKALDFCEHPCKCEFIYKPVCGIDGRNYINECDLKCKKIQRAFAGRCETQPLQKCLHCLGDISPVCGQDGVTYDNICYLKCSGKDIQYQGKCLPASPDGLCICPKIFLPVCGKDHKTYDNECSARCVNKEIKHTGACIHRPRRHHHHHSKSDCSESDKPKWTPKAEDCDKSKDDKLFAAFMKARADKQRREGDKKDKSSKWNRQPIRFVSNKDAKKVIIVGSSN